jgi:AraC family transcriptional regulator
MEELVTGQFFGLIKEKTSLEGLMLTDMEYTHDRVDWHYHENPYLTFLLAGQVMEGNKKEIYRCTAGSLLFHNWQDAHYNIKPKGFTRGFQVELDEAWFKKYDISTESFQGSLSLDHPQQKALMYNLFKESKLNGSEHALVVDTLLVQLFDSIGKKEGKNNRSSPKWVVEIRDILHNTQMRTWTLLELATQLKIHPVHLSRDFNKHFGSTLGEYIRTLRLERALVLLTGQKTSLSTIAFECGFSDQSHFIRSFKAVYKINPLAYKKLLD